MVCKKFIYLFLSIIISHNTLAKVLYEKNNLIITTIDVNIYKDLYEKNYGSKIDKNNAIKDLVLIKNLINNLEKNNKDFLDRIDDHLLAQYGNENINNLNVKDFLRFSKIKDEFIINYFNNKLVIEEVENIFKNIESLELPISKNNCLIIDEIIDLKDNKDFVKTIFHNLKNNKNDFKLSINDTDYKVCINEKNIRSIERLIINYIEKQTNEEFRYFVYGKTKY